MMKKILFIITIILSIFTSCEPYYFYDDYDWYYDMGPNCLTHFISANGEMFYVRTYNCPHVTYDYYLGIYCCWDGNHLILRSSRPIIVNHSHNWYK